VNQNEIESLAPYLDKMWGLVHEFRKKYNRGRAIAAPQIGLSKRIICINSDQKYALINPEIVFDSKDTMEIWDDCMSFPNLLVKVYRYKSLKLSFYDQSWNRKEWFLTGDMAELIQHEYDHLDGVLAVDKAIDKNSFRWIED
jgi:peptide deformylase